MGKLLCVGKSDRDIPHRLSTEVSQAHGKLHKNQRVEDHEDVQGLLQVRDGHHARRRVRVATEHHEQRKGESSSGGRDRGEEGEGDGESCARGKEANELNIRVWAEGAHVRRCVREGRGGCKRGALVPGRWIVTLLPAYALQDFVADCELLHCLVVGVTVTVRMELQTALAVVAFAPHTVCCPLGTC